MSYKTVKVELENGRVRPLGSETLPDKARALLTILTAAPSLKSENEDGALADRVADLAGIGRGDDLCRFDGAVLVTPDVNLQYFAEGAGLDKIFFERIFSSLLSSFCNNQVARFPRRKCQVS